jgi:hypothetical protein
MKPSAVDIEGSDGGRKRARFQLDFVPMVFMTFLHSLLTIVLVDQRAEFGRVIAVIDALNRAGSEFDRRTERRRNRRDRFAIAPNGVDEFELASRLFVGYTAGSM